MNPPIPEDQSDEDTVLAASRNRCRLRKFKRESAQQQRGSVLTWELLEEEMDAFLLENYLHDSDDVSLAETAEPPSDLILPLLRYQKEWLAWSLKQEESTFKGGILADEMGMGKTVQAQALVLAQRQLKKAASGSSILSSSPSTSQELPKVKGTLVVCPVIGAMQWFHEIERCTTEGSNKTLVYHGAKRDKCMYKLEEYDFVITTYSTIQADCRPKKSKQNSKNSTWTDDGSIDNSVSVGEDVSRRKSVLHSMKWERIILDEVRFLQVRPYAYYFFEGCNCSGLDLSFSGVSAQCLCEPRRYSRHFLWWTKYIKNRLFAKRHKSIAREAMVLLEHKILKSLLLRCIKMERVADLSLPTKTVIMRKDSLDVSEYNDYKSLHSRIRAQFNRLKL